MYKSAGRFQQRLARKPRNKLSRPLRRFGEPKLMLNRLDAEVARATPSLRKRTESVATKRVYFVRFTLRSDPHVTFVKIGVTAYAITERFFLDLDRYDIAVICETPHLPERMALSREADLHNAFKKFSFYPKVRLRSGGNTECYLLYGKPYDRVIEIIKSWTPGM
jgi:hypothetical protein